MALLSCASNPSDEENVQADPPVELPKDVPPLKDYGGIGGAFALRDQRGEIFHLEDLDGRPAMLFFGYTYCPDICPVTLSKMAAVYRLLDIKPTDLQTIFITVDPSRDSSTRLKEYTDLIHDKLIGLTGSEKQIGKVKKNFMVYGSKNGSGDNYLVDHSTFTYLISNTGKLLWHFKRQDKPEEIKNRIECIIENED